MTLPAFGLGTFRLKGQTVFDTVTNALDLGYRAIDTAQIYENEADIGRALAASGVKRDELYLTTKIWVDNFAHDKLIPSLKDSLSKLGTDRVDLTLIHLPSPANAVSMDLHPCLLYPSDAADESPRADFSWAELLSYKLKSSPSV